MELGLTGKVAIIGGASQGIGYAAAHMLAAEGASVAIWARRNPALENAAERIRGETGARVLAVLGDVRKGEDIARVVAATTAEFGRIDIAVNNDGAPPLGEALSFDDAAWHKAVEQNLMSVVRMSRLCVPEMQRVGGGRIINVTALSVLRPLVGFGLSVSTWAAVVAFAKTLSREVGPHGITVNTLCPGRIDTPRWQKVMGQRSDVAEAADTASMSEQLLRQVPIGRLGKPEEMAAMICFLASGHAAFLTGLTLAVDGGALESLL
jgi:3-oxoacyl-[acyl-carrier protein] reductase